MVAVVAAMGGEIEGDRQALLPGGEIAPIERIGIFGGGEAGILPDRPRLGHVHGRVGAAQIRRDAGIGVEGVQALERIGGVDALDRNASGVSHGAAGSAPRSGASAKSICEKSGIWLIRLPDLDTKHIVSVPQCRQGIAALVNERLHAGCFQSRFLFARPSRQIDVPRAGRLECLRSPTAPSHRPCRMSRGRRARRRMPQMLPARAAVRSSRRRPLRCRRPRRNSWQMWRAARTQLACRARPEKSLAAFRWLRANHLRRRAKPRMAPPAGSRLQSFRRDAGRDGAGKSTFASPSERWGNMLTPVSASCRRATATARLARTSATFCWTSPLG